MDSLDSLKPFGTLATYGNASGKVEPFDPGILAPRGSLYVTRPTLGTHTATRELLTGSIFGPWWRPPIGHFFTRRLATGVVIRDKYF